MSQTAPYSASFAQLHTRLALYGIEVTPSVRQRRTEPEVYGVVFAKDGHRMKGSEVGKAFSASNLQKVFAQHEAQVKTAWPDRSAVGFGSERGPVLIALMTRLALPCLVRWQTRPWPTGSRRPRCRHRVDLPATTTWAPTDRFKVWVAAVDGIR